MIVDWPIWACLALALWSALVAGVFSAFSEFVMRALSLARPTAGMEAMQKINVTVLRSSFVLGLIAIAPLSVAFAAYAITELDGAARVAAILAAGVYLPGVFMTTVAGNVPMNNALARLNPESSQAAAYWPLYLRRWTRLNHVRTLASLFTAILYLAAAMMLARSAG